MTNDSPQPPNDSNTPFSDETAQYLKVYLDESEEELEGLIEAILQLEVNPHDSAALNKSFRMLHSLKGSSGMLGFEVVGNFAHELEDRFERYRSGQAVLDRETTTVILRCIDYFRAFLGRLQAGDHSEGDPVPLLNQLRELEQRRPPGAAPAKPGTAERPPLTVSGGLRVVVHFRSGLQLADLKARLIVSRLSAIGEVIGCEPPIDDVSSFEELPLFSLTLVTDRPVGEVRKIANVDGVESLEIQGSELTAEILETAQKAAEKPGTAAAIESIAIAPAESPGPSQPVRSSDVEASDEKTRAAETLRVDIGRLDHLMNLTGELVIANARFSQITSDMSPLFRRSADFKKSKELTERLRQRFDELRQSLHESSPHHDDWSRISQGLEDDLAGLDRQAELWEEGHYHFAKVGDAVDQLTRVSKNLQRGVLNTRMVPVGPLFNRFKRVVRDLSVERGKQVQLVIQGEKTELDKRMIDTLGDPLLHLVRNSIDHGLESPERRRAAGKPEAGTIRLEATHRGNNVLITVRDDGAGINVDRIRARIIERGLAAAAQVAEMTEPQIIAHIWHPGFSTAESITEVSGRGVGMDIVRSAITGLNGTIDVASASGAGTTFTIRLPLTLAIIHSLMMRYRHDYFSIPIDDVREIVSIPRDQVYSVHHLITIDVRGELIPLVSMEGVFHWASTAVDSSESEAASGPASGAVNVVVVNTRGKTLGLSVDSLVGRADLVIKSLSENFQPVRGLSGASILGDGAVCLMLDSAAIIELASERARRG